MTILCVESTCRTTAAYPLPEKHGWGEVTPLGPLQRDFEWEGIVCQALGYCPEHNKAKRHAAHAVPVATERQGRLL